MILEDQVLHVHIARTHDTRKFHIILAQEFHVRFMTVDAMLHNRRRKGVHFSTGVKSVFKYSMDGRAARQMLSLWEESNRQRRRAD